MASLRQSPGGTFFVTFRYQGQRFERSLGTTNPSTARQKKAQVERTLGHLKDGVLSLPEDCTADRLWQFVRSGGKITELPSVRTTRPLEAACREYLDSFTEGTKDRSTLDTEKHHLNHLKRHLGGRVTVDTICTDDIERYVRQRQGEKGTRGRKVRPVTIGKELQTVRQLWDFAKRKGYVFGENPVHAVRKPRASQKPPFMTWEEIEARTARGGLSNGEIAELWDCLFLRESEIGEFLEQVRKRAATLRRFPWIHPALCFCAYTGARRSEMFRCLVDDVKDTIVLREKKRSQRLEFTFRDVPLHPELRDELNQWLNRHPGGQYLFCKNNGNSLDDKTSREGFTAVTKRSKWTFLRGYHVLRHSFASNLARHGVDQYKIDAMMGHQTEEMRLRYRHLFPEDRQEAVRVLSFRDRRPAA